jgi:hypothetical protein
MHGDNNVKDGRILLEHIFKEQVLGTELPQKALNCRIPSSRA